MPDRGVDDGWAEAGGAVKEAAFPTSGCGLEDCFSVPQNQCGYIRGPAISLWLQAWFGHRPLFTQFQDCAGIWHHTVLWGKTGQLNKQGYGWCTKSMLMSVWFWGSCRTVPCILFSCSLSWLHSNTAIGTPSRPGAATASLPLLVYLISLCIFSFLKLFLGELLPRALLYPMLLTLP